MSVFACQTFTRLMRVIQIDRFNKFHHIMSDVWCACSTSLNLFVFVCYVCNFCSFPAEILFHFKTLQIKTTGIIHTYSIFFTKQNVLIRKQFFHKISAKLTLTDVEKMSTHLIEQKNQAPFRMLRNETKSNSVVGNCSVFGTINKI